MFPNLWNICRTQMCRLHRHTTKLHSAGAWHHSSALWDPYYRHCQLHAERKRKEERKKKDKQQAVHLKWPNGVWHPLKRLSFPLLALGRPPVLWWWLPLLKEWRGHHLSLYSCLCVLYWKNYTLNRQGGGRGGILDRSEHSDSYLCCFSGDGGLLNHTLSLSLYLSDL